MIGIGFIKFYTFIALDDELISLKSLVSSKILVEGDKREQ